MTIVIDDAGSGDLLYGVVVGAYRSETHEFTYGIIDVSNFQRPNFRRKEYLKQASTIVFRLLRKLKPNVDEPIHMCKGYIFDEAVEDLRKAGNMEVLRVKVEGEAQHLTELAYLDEIRNLGYEPIAEREGKRAKSFFHMLRWLNKNPDKMKYAKTGWPRLSRYRLFKAHSHGKTTKKRVNMHKSKLGSQRRNS